MIPDPPHATALVACVVHENLVKRLQEVAKCREEETPEPQSPEDLEECYQWRCEELRNNFKPHEVDKQRMHISQLDYWRTECFHYDVALKEVMWQRAHAAHGVDGEPSADHWRTVAMVYRELLKSSGLSLAQTRAIRFSIESQKYWQYEAEMYQQNVVAREEEMRAALRKRDDRQHNVKRQIRSRQAAQPGQRKNDRDPPGGSIASRTRSRTKVMTGSGVAKRRNLGVGAKAAGPW
ncbi:hypothetical protein ED733_001283 [Metarhizium rileyi]|uniref:Uncharacterized protein n=1 Tax=Metarhizium rileyi (strain RCEF 4871) TaxID=1649241 RepID=A0A5C6G077_METRR|nr:hypothetical protein ED733_001283 [Metarhizium rileyi]